MGALEAVSARVLKGAGRGIALLALAVLAGCASTVTSEVTAFRDPGWKADAPRTYAFTHGEPKGAGKAVPKDTSQAARAGAPGAARAEPLEWQTYELWLANALAMLGFEQAPPQTASYLVSMAFRSDPRLVQVQETYYPDPWFGPGWGPGPYWGAGYYRGAWGPWGPGYWPPQTVIRDVPATLSTLRIFFDDAASGKRVYEVTARNLSDDMSPPRVMPYLIRSALSGFPLESGRPVNITLEVDKPVR